MKKEKTTLVKELCSRVLRMFGRVESHRLGLHDLYSCLQATKGITKGILHERDSVLFAIEVLRREGLIESRGGDFYSTTEKGKQVIASLGH